MKPKSFIFFLAVLAAFGQAGPFLPDGAVQDSASFGTVIAPGMLVSIIGNGLALRTVMADSDPPPTVLDGVSVELDDGVQTLQAPLLAVSPGQISAQMPYLNPGTTLAVRVRNANGVSNPNSVTLVDRAPRIFTAGAGTGDALLFHSDFSLVSQAAPAVPGEAVTLYATGLGAVKEDGTVPDAVAVTLADQPAQVQSASRAGYPGLYLVSFVVPSAGSGSLDIALSMADRRSQPNVKAAVSDPSSRREHFVSPNGSAQGDGSRNSPWDIATALKPAPAIQPGDTLWLLGGTYGNGSTIFESRLAGTADKPIRVRQYAGERATINGGLAIYGPHTWYWGFEVTNLNPDRSTSRGAPECVDTYDGSAGVKLINLVLHDCTQGIGFWTPAENGEAYGNLIYYNGYQGSDRGHGHGIYAQNREGTKSITDNIIFDQFGLGIQAYGSSNASVRGFNVQGNIVFNNGVISKDATNVDNILFAVGQPMDGIRVENNYTYHDPDANKGYSRIGWSLGNLANKDVVVRNNYWIGGQTALEMWYWDSVTFTGNTTYSKTSINMILSMLPAQNSKTYNWDNNTYYGRGVFRVGGEQNSPWDAWRTLTGVDANSRMVGGAPTGTWTFVRPNKYESGRANIAIYNWDRSDNVAVDLSGALSSGDKYEIRDALNFFGDPVAAGTYSGGSVPVPMTGLKPAAPVGTVPAPPVHPAPQFGAFILLKK